MPQMLIVLVLIVLGGGYFLMSSEGTSEPTPAVPVVTETMPAPVAPVVSMKKKYFDGQYSAEGSYVIPNKEVEKITVSLTLKDSVVTAVDFTGNPEEQASKFNQMKFREGFMVEVVGKNIDDIALTVVNGASLTPKGFMDALEAIKVKAQSTSAV